MKNKIEIFPLILLLIVLIFGILTKSESLFKATESDITQIGEYTSVPNFTTYNPNVSRTSNFINFLTPIIESENYEILTNRKNLKKLMKKSHHSSADTTWLHQTAKYYKLKKFSITPQTLFELLERIDIIPIEIVLSQAAIESNWGASGFAKRGNNLFGMRTTSQKSGIIPKDRATGATFRVASYRTVNQSVKSYLRNLNTHKAYKKLRKNRAIMRTKNIELNPFELANDLTAYSTLGYDYVLMIKRTMNNYQNDYKKNRY